MCKVITSIQFINIIIMKLLVRLLQKNKVCYTIIQYQSALRLSLTSAVGVYSIDTARTASPYFYAFASDQPSEAWHCVLRLSVCPSVRPSVRPCVMKVLARFLQTACGNFAKFITFKCSSGQRLTPCISRSKGQRSRSKRHFPAYGSPSTIISDPRRRCSA